MNFKIFLLFGLVLFVCTENVKSLPVPDEKGSEKEELKPAETEAAAEPKKDDEEEIEEDISLTDLDEIKEFFEELQKGFDEIFKALKEAQEESLSKEKASSTTPKSERK